MNKNTPADVSKWLKNIGNQFHIGGGYTCVELLDEILTCEDQWLKYRTEKDIKTSNCPTRSVS